MRVRTNLQAGELTVYGADWCGWTKKQRRYLDQKGIPYTYVNCDSQECPSFVSGFPTLVKDGQVMAGFQEL
jgi:glutaredoxin